MRRRSSALGSLPIHQLVSQSRRFVVAQRTQADRAASAVCPAHLSLNPCTSPRPRRRLHVRIIEFSMHGFASPGALLVWASLAASTLAAPAELGSASTSAAVGSTSRSLSVNYSGDNALDGPDGDFRKYDNKVVLLRHGEKGRDGSIGLNLRGQKRAKCLRKVRFLAPFARKFRADAT